MKAAEENREFIIEGMLKSLKTLSLLADGEDPTTIQSGMAAPKEGNLVTSFTNFEVKRLSSENRHYHVFFNHFLCGDSMPYSLT